MNKPIHVLVLFGPTASGKTAILKKIFNHSSSKAEVVSADSIQVYRGMDIGTAKPSAEERSLLPHHLIDIRSPSEQFNAGDFVHLAEEACLQIAERGRLPVISGGTGFYLKNFILGLSEAPPSDQEIRRQLKIDLNEKGIASLMEELANCDPVSAGRIHINDEYRLLRALEVYRSCGRPLSSFEVNSAICRSAYGGGACESDTACYGQKRGDYNFNVIGLSRPREELYSRVNRRCAQMFEQGLAAEVRSLFEAGYTPDDPGMRAIGYREFFVEAEEEPARESSLQKARLTGAGKWRLLNDVEGVQALVAQNSRRYAKRQITFFAKIPGVKWIECGDDDEETAEMIRREL